MSTAPSTTTHTDAVETTLVAGVGDACTNCGARLAAEQRYCVECGERRGQAKLPFADAIDQRAQAQAAAATPPKKRHGLTANGALIAGVGTLILALGVGVLIGRSGNNSGSKAAAAPQVIHVDGGVSTGTTGSTAAAAAAGAGAGKAAAKSKKSSKSSSSSAKSPLSKQTVQPKGSNVPPPAVKVGSPGHGRGYKNGKFTGDFFGQ